MSLAKIFIAYSHKDEQFREELEKHLKIFKRNGFIEIWTDRELMPGVEWNKEIIYELVNANIIIFLVSPDFLASDYIYDIEVKKAISQHELGVSKIIPVIVRHCDWQSTPIGKIQGLPMNAKPISAWHDRDEAFLSVANELKKILAKQQGVYEKPTIKSDTKISESDKILGKATSEILDAIPSKYNSKGIVRRFSKGSIYIITNKGNLDVSVEEGYQARINLSSIGICYEIMGGTGS
ncbi:MAG TPA: toll/interleukin-1 receptor domain-containing protein, partial [Saprospiraceae bacterium]|nr:toll/interleukin-1 receptor domain-containing protein [Saprospiraceae bacterium]